MATITSFSGIIEQLIAHLHWYTQHLEDNLHNNYFDNAVIENMRENQMFSVIRVDELPAVGSNEYLYLVQTSGKDTNLGTYNEYLWFPIEQTYECIGSTEFDMRNYWKVDEVNEFLDGKMYKVNVADFTLKNMVNDENYIGVYQVDALPELFNSSVFTLEEGAVVDENGLLTAGTAVFQNGLVSADTAWTLTIKVNINDITTTDEATVSYGKVLYHDDVIEVKGRQIIGYYSCNKNISSSTAGAVPQRNSSDLDDPMKVVQGRGYSYNIQNGSYYIRVEYNPSTITYKFYYGTSLDNMTLHKTCKVPDFYKIPNSADAWRAGESTWVITASSTTSWDLHSLEFTKPHQVNNDNQRGSYFRESALYQVTNGDKFDFYLYKHGKYELIAPADYVHYAELSNYYTKAESYNKGEVDAVLDTWKTLNIDGYTEFSAESDFITDYWDEKIGGYGVEKLPDDEVTLPDIPEIDGGEEVDPVLPPIEGGGDVDPVEPPPYDGV